MTEPAEAAFLELQGKDQKRITQPLNPVKVCNWRVYIIQAADTSQHTPDVGRNLMGGDLHASPADSRASWN
jgi:hypothetical protein